MFKVLIYTIFFFFLPKTQKRELISKKDKDHYVFSLTENNNIWLFFTRGSYILSYRKNIKLFQDRAEICPIYQL